MSRRTIRTAGATTLVRAAALVATVALAGTACTSKGSTGASSTTPSGSAPAATTAAGAAPTSAAPTAGASVAPSASAAATTAAPPDPASVHANELGRIPVMMYHRLVAHPASDYERTPADFVADLTYLEKNGFVPVTAGDFVAGKIDIPAGKHPVVLTFDDGTVSQFALGPDGKPKPGTALALLQKFASSHPDFPAIATFYVNKAPFGTSAGEGALAYLTAHGDEVGVHTVDHPDLTSLTDAKVQAEIADNLVMINKADPAQKVTTMALPFGARPKVHALAEKGSSGGTSYDLAGVFAVGAGPSHSPYNATFDPFYIPRIRAENVADAKKADQPYVSGSLLPQLVADKSELYTSDGDPSKVSYPRTTTLTVAPRWKSEAQPY
jgi:peptidoglycan/xylan/chitin deacetylase (PgdA/CDA1 family)